MTADIGAPTVQREAENGDERRRLREHRERRHRASGRGADVARDRRPRRHHPSCGRQNRLTVVDAEAWAGRVHWSRRFPCTCRDRPDPCVMKKRAQRDRVSTPGPAT